MPLPCSSPQEVNSYYFFYLTSFSGGALKDETSSGIRSRCEWSCGDPVFAAAQLPGVGGRRQSVASGDTRSTADRSCRCLPWSVTETPAVHSSATKRDRADWGGGAGASLFTPKSCCDYWHERKDNGNGNDRTYS